MFNFFKKIINDEKVEVSYTSDEKNSGDYDLEQLEERKYEKIDMSNIFGTDEYLNKNSKVFHYNGNNPEYNVRDIRLVSKVGAAIIQIKEYSEDLNENDCKWKTVYHREKGEHEHCFGEEEMKIEPYDNIYKCERIYEYKMKRIVSLVLCDKEALQIVKEYFETLGIKIMISKKMNSKKPKIELSHQYVYKNDGSNSYIASGGQ